jgi:selenocysteine lyase/cysteine desulfurase
MSISRRDLLALAATLPGFGTLAHATASEQRVHIGRLPHQPEADDEAAWELIARQFLIEGIHLNTGTYGSCPIPVLEATIHHLRAFERMTRQEHPDMVAGRAALEKFLGAWPGSVAVVRNTTEAMNIVANGIDFEPGDEILTTTHEHIGGRCCWELQAKRRGAVLKTFDPPLDPSGDAFAAAAWMEHVTPRTRVMSISHVLFTTGLIQPVAALVRMAREKGIITVIDGAHPPGMLALDVRAVDADFYASSPHKWLLAPKGTGLLITRPGGVPTPWPLIASGEWDVDDYRRFEHVGTISESLMAGLFAAVAFQQAIGREAIEGRVRSLSTQLYHGLRSISGVQVVSPRRAQIRSAMVSFVKSGVSAERLQSILAVAGIRTRRISEAGLEYLRLSTHINVLPRDLERTLTLISSAA